MYLVNVRVCQVVVLCFIAVEVVFMEHDSVDGVQNQFTLITTPQIPVYTCNINRRLDCHAYPIMPVINLTANIWHRKPLSSVVRT